jgi:hypothetical protein
MNTENGMKWCLQKYALLAITARATRRDRPGF